MAKKKDENVLRQSADSAEVAKQRMIEIEDALREAGYIRYANEIEAIIIRLEIWQNRINRR